MRPLLHLRLALSVAALVFPSAACSGNADAAGSWAGSIDTLAGGRVQVTNPEQGVWKEGKGWTLTEEVRVGAVEGEGPDVFGRVSDLEVDALGRIWVADGQAQEIRVFDSGGKHVRTVGRKGGGPGEFARLGGLKRAPDGKLWVYDPGNTRFTVLDTSGALSTSHPRDQGMSIMPWTGGFDAHGRFYDGGAVLTGQEFEMALFRYDVGTMQAVDTFRIPAYKSDAFEVSRGSASYRAAVPFAPAQVWSRARDGGVWIGVNGSYAFHHVTLGGDTMRTVSREFTAVPVSDKDRAESVERLEWFTKQGGRVDAGRMPRVKPAYRSIFQAEDGHLWVKPSLPLDAPPAYDVFDPEGRYLGRVSFPEDVADVELFVVRDGVVYARVRDADEVEYVARYRIGGGKR